MSSATASDAKPINAATMPLAAARRDAPKREVEAMAFPLVPRPGDDSSRGGGAAKDVKLRPRMARRRSSFKNVEGLAPRSLRRSGAPGPHLIGLSPSHLGIDRRMRH